MAGSVISGTVTSAGGEPLVAARVQFVQSPVPMPDIAALTNEEGGFSLGAPVAGTYGILIAADGYLNASETIEITGEQAQIEISIELVEAAP